MLYSSVVIANSKCLPQLSYTAHFGDFNNNNNKIDDLKFGDLVGDFTKKLVTRMDGAP